MFFPLNKFNNMHQSTRKEQGRMENGTRSTLPPYASAPDSSCRELNFQRHWESAFSRGRRWCYPPASPAPFRRPVDSSLSAQTTVVCWISFAPSGDHHRTTTQSASRFRRSWRSSCWWGRSMPSAVDGRGFDAEAWRRHCWRHCCSRGDVATTDHNHHL